MPIHLDKRTSTMRRNGGSTMTTKAEHYSKGLDLYGQQNYENAIGEYQKAFEMDPEDGEICLAISMAYLQMNDLDTALEYAQKAAELSPREPLVYTNLSRILQQKGMIPEAEDAMAISRQLSSGM
ncbi:tetratricopeptide repeat protein [bacterium]|nr:tetratricopeptide repeat protein [bacterium]